MKNGFNIDRRKFIAKLGGAAAVAAMSSEVLGDALEDELMETGYGYDDMGSKRYGAEGCLDREIFTASNDIRRGAGWIFDKTKTPVLDRMPAQPTLVDFFNHRFTVPSVEHCLKCAKHALDEGQDEVFVFASLVHDIVMTLFKGDHAWWGYQLIGPYVDERVAWAVRYHQALRFLDDPETDYTMPELYNCVFGKDYVPEPYIQQAQKEALAHEWYIHARMITVNDLYGFTPGPQPVVEDFVDIIGRNWKQPQEGLGYDNTSASHMWRALLDPDRPL